MSIHDQPELQPWAILTREGSEAHLALWQIALPVEEHSPTEAQAAMAVALFSQRAAAEAYREENAVGAAQVVQLDKLQTLRVMMSAYQQGLRYAALDPGVASARQIFVLRDVLRAARSELASGDLRDELELG